MMRVRIRENHLGSMQTIEENSVHVEMNYSEILESSFVAQPVNDDAMTKIMGSL